MNLCENIIHVLVLTLLSNILTTEAKPKKKSSTKSIKSKHKAKKQFFPGAQAGFYPNIYKPGLQKVHIVKGLPKGYDCTIAKYGCCWDGRTPAHGEAGKSCPQCRDVYKDFCKKTKHLCHFPMVADYCRITCKLCSNGKKNCQKSKYNCCWDGKTAMKGEGGKGCPKIKDKLGKKCEKFDAECLRNPYFMWTMCRETCLKNLPPIEPYLQMLTPTNNMAGAPTPYGQPAMQPGMSQGHAAPGLLFPSPYPGLPQVNNTVGKKASTKRKHQGLTG